MTFGLVISWRARGCRGGNTRGATGLPAADGLDTLRRLMMGLRK